MWTETSPLNFKTEIKRKENSRPLHVENLSTSESTINNSIYKRNFIQCFKKHWFYINNSYCLTK